MRKLFSLVAILAFYISLSVAQTTKPAQSGSAKVKKETNYKK
jgi:colicin import membrane protein